MEYILWAGRRVTCDTLMHTLEFHCRQVVHAAFSLALTIALPALHGRFQSNAQDQSEMLCVRHSLGNCLLSMELLLVQTGELGAIVAYMEKKTVSVLVMKTELWIWP